MYKCLICKSPPLRITSTFCMLVLFSFITIGCGGSSSNPIANLIPETETENEPEPENEAPNPNTEDLGNNSLFTGKLIFSTSFGKPLKIFDFSTNMFDLSLVGDVPNDSLIEADLDPTAAYAAYTRAPADGLVTGKSVQVVLRDNSLNQEFRLPFETRDPDQALTSSKPSVSSTGIVVFEYSTIMISDGFPIGIANTGIAYWNGAGQFINLADSAVEPSRPRITEDGNTVYFVADSDSGKAIWKTSLAADTPVLVWAPDSGERLSNVAPVFDISNDGSTIAFGVQSASQNEMRYITPNDQRIIDFAASNSSIVTFRVSGNGSKLIVQSFSPNEQVGIVHQLHVANVADGSVVIAEDSTRDGIKYNPPALPALAVSFSGDAVAMVTSEYNGNSDYSLFAFKPGEFSTAQQRIVSDVEYDGLVSLALAMRFRGD